MKKTVYALVVLTLISSCKNDKKDIKESKEPVEIIEKKTPTFEDNLLDLRDVNKDLIAGFKVEKFGMQKINDSIYGFAFKLDESVTEKTVELYSVGIRGFLDGKNVLQFPSSPDIKIKENNKYLILRKKLENIKYFDSIDVYIYERRNWKKSGKLGGFRLRDIVFED